MKDPQWGNPDSALELGLFMVLARFTEKQLAF